jgi:hypothetical protein
VAAPPLTLIPAHLAMTPAFNPSTCASTMHLEAGTHFSSALTAPSLQQHLQPSRALDPRLVSAHSRGFHGRLAFEEERTYSKCTGVLHGSEYSLAPGRDSVEQLMVRCAACARVNTEQSEWAMILMEHGLQKQPHAQRLCTVDSTSGRHINERESVSTGSSTAASRWMDWRTILSQRTILTILTQL